MAAIVVAGFLLVVRFAAADQASEPAFVSRPESDLTLFAVRLGQTALSDAIPTYPTADGRGFLLPLGEMTRLLSLAIEVDVSRGTASGFVLRENRRFELDAVRGRVILAGTEQTIDRALVEVHQDDIYVDSRLLSQWLPVDFTIDQYVSLVTLRAREPLPVQAREERERRGQQVERASPGGEPLPERVQPYEWAVVPFVDASVQVASRAAPGGTDQSAVFSTHFTGEILKSTADVFVTGSDDDPLGEARASLSRRDPYARLLGRLRATEIVAGEVFDPGLDMVTLATSGPGLLLSNFAIARSNQFDRYTITGDLAVGWQVELYQNDALIGFQTSRADGRYEFQDVPLIFGLNVFRLVFYGPQGQVRQEFLRLNIGETLAPEGKLRYRVVGDDARGRTPRGSLEVDYGVRRWLSTRASLTRAELEDGTRHSYGKIGIAGFWRNVFAHMDAARDIGAGSAAQVAAQTRIGRLSVTGRYAVLDDFNSEVFRPTYGLIRDRASLRLDGIVPAGRGNSAVIGFEGRRDGLEGGDAIYELALPISAQLGGTYVSHRLTSLFASSVAAIPDDFTQGSFLLSRSLGSARIRGELSYIVRSRNALNAGSVALEKTFAQRYFVQSGVVRRFASESDAVFATLSRHTGPFAVGGSVVVENGDVTAIANASVGLSFDPRFSRWHWSARSTASSGAVSVRVFIDHNGNGQYEPGEPPVEDARLVLNGAGIAGATGADGTIFISALPAGVEQTLTLSTASLEDTLFQPLVPGVRFVPRPGRTVLVDFPIIVTGEIRGTVFIGEGSGGNPVGGARIELVDAAGAPVRRAVSAFDGFYEMIRIPPGTYHIKVASPRVRGREVLHDGQREIIIGTEGTVLDGFDLVIELSKGD